MGLLSKVECAECRNPAGPIMRVKLNDGNYICSKCARIIPTYAYGNLLQDYSLDDFHAFKKYIQFSKEQLAPIFEETASYYTIHLDDTHGLFYLGNPYDKEKIFLKLENVLIFDLVYNGKEFSSGVTGQKVEGDVLFEIAVSEPFFKHEEKLATGIKAKAKKTLFGSKVSYENPKGMDDFVQAFSFAWNECLDEKYGSDNQTPDSELKQAMALFMLDSLDDVTLECLKAQRNRLIKAFHPDKGDLDDTKFAQKINNAYDILKNAIR